MVSVLAAITLLIGGIWYNARLQNALAERQDALDEKETQRKLAVDRSGKLDRALGEVNKQLLAKRRSLYAVEVRKAYEN